MYWINLKFYKNGGWLKLKKIEGSYAEFWKDIYRLVYNLTPLSFDWTVSTFNKKL